VSDRLSHIAYHVRNYYWLDLDGLNKIYRYGVEVWCVSNELAQHLSATIQIGYWLSERGYLVGNLGPAWMDFRFFTQEIYWLSLPPSLVSSKRKPSWI